MRILIAGGGISGLSMAIALKQKGYEPEIVEKDDSWRAEGAGLHLPGNAVKPLEQLGLLEAVQRKSFSFPALRYCNQADKKLFDLDLKDGSWPEFQAISREDFHGILVEKADETKVHFGKEIKSISQKQTDELGPVAVEFSDGSLVEYDLVIAADGINSSLRGLLFGPELKPEPTGIACWRWLTDFTGDDKPHFMLGKGKVLLVMPITKDRAYIFASISDPDGNYSDRPEDAVETLRSEFADFGGPVPHILKDLECSGPVLPGSLQQMMVSEWVKGACLLTGDAAHGTLPTMAQGATMAMEDALALADELERKDTLQEALAGYKARRIPRAQWVQKQSLKRMGLAGIKSGALVFLRNQLMKSFGAKILASGWRPLIKHHF